MWYVMNFLDKIDSGDPNFFAVLVDKVCCSVAKGIISRYWLNVSQ